MKMISRTALALLATAALSGSVLAQDMKKVAISTIVEVPALVETKEGVLKGLADKGFVEGKNLEIDYQNANGNMPTQQQIAKKFVGDNPDVIVPITTPTSQAMIATTDTIPVVFTTVTDPLKAKLIPQYEKPGGNVTGVSDAAPIKQQLELMRELVPDLKTIGFVYNPGLDNAIATLEELKKQAEPLGISVVESASPTTNEVALATKKLIGKVEAVYIPNDTTVVAALEAIVKIGEDVDLPIFAGETGAVARGVIGSVGLDYVELGRITGHIAARVLNGEKAGDIDAVIAYQVLTEFKVAINKKAAAAMGVELPEAVLARATEIIE
ncbi:ABC transporter substrate-binding protein [Nitratireductor pacificus]|uniref:ABC transporter periplasmic substrate-binding protein n=1 Tax=Nitratireductor pacificus pht-3B TaxID=391937 RepID=K2LPG3_9HYPH|nr:ABC transporter substrate binding protein [Nitratireductor pacificus]EKF19584.1 ABC transporter periplasmic substrate-binding protein [Nitratireductor pacificus pht-3B]